MPMNAAAFRMTFCVVLCALNGVGVAQLSPENLDGVCKSSRMAAGYVPVKELESVQCGSQDPFDKNAWLVDRVREGIVSCQPIDYSDLYAPLSHVVCERVHTDDCPAIADGAANGYVLRSPQHCRDAKTEIGCHHPQGLCSDDGGVAFLHPPQPLRGATSRPQDFIERVIVSKSITAPGVDISGFGLKVEDPSIAKELVYRRLDAGDYVPACVKFLDRSIRYSSDAWLYEHWTRTVPLGRNARSGRGTAPTPRERTEQDMNVIVRAVRRFHDPACPSDSREPTADLNAVILTRGMSPSERRQGQVFACPMATGFSAKVAPGVSARFHDDRCGVSNGENSVRVNVGR